MRIRIHQLVVPLDYEARDVITATAGRLGLPVDELSDVTIVRRSIDARKRHGLSHAQVQMTRELGLNPSKLGKLDNNDQVGALSRLPFDAPAAIPA